MKKKRKAQADEIVCFADKSLRTVYIAGEINSGTASKFRRVFRAIDSTEGEIQVEINSCGGDETAGLMIMDTILHSDNPVVTRATGMTMSMGAMILVAGDIREALPMASIMVHQSTFVLRARMEEADNELAELKRSEELCWNILDQRTGNTPDFWKTRCAGKNLYLTVEQALELGLIHRIIGRQETCDSN